MAFIKGQRPAAKKTTTAKTSSKPALPTYKAPVDFKPFFMALKFETSEDGLLINGGKFIRFKGRFDLEAPLKKRHNMMEYDPQTCLSIMSRVSSKAFAKPTPKTMPVSPKQRAGLKGAHRLPASTGFIVAIRAGVKKENRVLTARVTQVFQLVKTKSGQVKPYPLEKTDPAYRMIRSCSRILPPAFVNSIEPPRPTRGQAAE